MKDILFVVVPVILIVAVLAYIPLKGSGFLPIGNSMIRPPLKPEDFKRRGSK